MEKKKDRTLIKLLEYKGKSRTYAVLIISTLFIAASNFLVSFLIQICINAAMGKMLTKLLTAGIVFIAVSVLCGIFYYLNGKYKEKISQEIAIVLKKNVFEHWLNIHCLDAKKWKEGDVLTLITDDADKCAKFVGYSLFPLLQMVLSILIGSVYTMYYSWQIFCVVVILSICLVILLTKLFSKISILYGDKQKHLGEQKDFFVDCYTGSESIKVNRMMCPIMHIFEKLYKKRYNSEIRLTKERAKSNTIMDNGILIIELIVLLLGVVLVNQKMISIGAMIGIWNASIGTFVYPLMDIPDLFSSFAETASSWDRISEILKADQENGEKTEVQKGEICLKGIELKFSEKVVLKGINLELHQGEMVVITGESGVGKTTLLNILMDFMKPTKGIIEFRNNKNKDIDQRNYFSFVPQGNSLLNLTIKENIMMGQEWAKKKVYDICKKIGLYEHIMNLPNKFETTVKEETMLSEGQAQRIAIMRALNRKAPFILLDEPFSALDAKSMNHVVKLLNESKKDYGIVIITHRDALNLDYDHWYEMKGGELIEK